MWMSIILAFPLLLSLSVFASGNECLECHEEELTKPFKHQAAVEDCSNCHDPDHEAQTGFPHRLYEATNKLCLNCHKFRAGFPTYGSTRPGLGHPNGGHPVSLAKDPLHPEKEFTCISCHNPHSSKMESLFRYDFSKETVYKGEKCAVCHWNYIFPGRPPQSPPWLE